MAELCRRTRAQGTGRGASNGDADLVLTNANVITLDTAAPRAQAVAIKDERILAVGTDDEMRALAGRGTEVRNLRGLTLYWNRIGTKGFRALAETANLPNLTWMSMGANDVRPAGLEAIVSSGNLPKLTDLNLAETWPAESGAGALNSMAATTRPSEATGPIIVTMLD